MMMSEFIERTGFEPTFEEYGEIEEAYYSFDGNKDQFCADWVKNDGAEKICRARAVKIAQLKSQMLELDREMKKAADGYEARIAKLEKQLEREQEWEPYEYKENVKQADYERLADAKAGTKVLSDEEAIEILADWWGFQPSKITILHEVKKLEKNRHNYVRAAGTYDRKPMYNATDWNYIRFDCGMMTYEMYNGDLRFFVH